MRRRQIPATLMLVLVLAGAVSLAAQSRSAEVEFKAAEQKELVRGDLKGAIKDYERIAKGSNRTLAAQAVLRIAGIHAKLGDAEARKVYERVVSQFPEQTAAVATARARLGSLSGTAHAIQGRREVEFAKGPLPSTFKMSPDGRYLSTTGDNGELITRDLRTGQTRPVTGTAKERGYEFASFGTFSPDGKQMVFLASGSPLTRGELRIVDLQERGIPRARKLFGEEAKPYGWTPDGKSIVVGIVRDDRSRHLGLVTVADGSYRELKPFFDDPVFLSPDGKYVANAIATAPGNGPRDLVVFAIENGQQVPRLEHPADDRVMGWSPDSRHLIFSSDRNTGSPALYAQLIAGGQPQGVPVLLQKDWAQVYPVAISSSGALFYRAPGTTSTATDIRIVAFDFERGQPASPSMLLHEERRGSVDSPGWSRDGKSLAYRLLHPGGQRASLIVRSLETGDSREFPLGFDINGNVKWHPDGKSLLVAQVAGARDPGVFRVDAATGEMTRIGNGMNVAVSPDGTTLYFRQPQPATAAGPGDVRIVARTLVSGVEREVIRRPLGPGFSLSPDGRYFAQHFIQARLDNRMLIVPVDGTAPREVPLPRTNLGFLTWTPDGRSILFGANDSSEMWQVAMDGRATKLNFIPEDWRAPGAWALHPDRRQVAYTSVASVGQQESGLWVLENFLSVLDPK